MTLVVRHATQVVGANDPNKQVSADAWNEGHEVTGSAPTADALATARTINGVAFDGSANINVPPYFGSGLFSAAPAPAAGNNGYCYFATDLGMNGTLLISTGSRWKPLGGSAILALLGAEITGVANSETLALQTLLPAGSWQLYDLLRFDYEINKSGTTDQCTARFRIGTAGTTADAKIISVVALAAANRAMTFYARVKQISDTLARKVGVNGLGSIASTGAEPSNVTISSASGNALYASLFILSGGTTDTVGCSAASISLVTP